MEKFGSDVVVELMRDYALKYVAMNPGASYRGLHDSLVNWTGDGPEMIICTNEKIAVQMAHGYARVTGRPMGAIVHNVVGLMQATMGIYTAYLDQVPVLIFGGTGPMASARRRPHIDWIHTAMMQGELVRNFVKWDDQPFDQAGVVDGFARAYQLAVQAPAGPVYTCYDLSLQEAPIDGGPEVHPAPTAPVDHFPAGDGTLREIADLLLDAERPVLVAGRVGRTRCAATALEKLAALLGAPVFDQQWRYNMANTHPQHFLDQSVLEHADLVLLLDVVDAYGAVTEPDQHDRGARRYLPAADAKLIEIRLDLLVANGWTQKFEQYQPVDRTVLANTGLALPALADIIQKRLGEGSQRTRVAQRRSQTSARHDELRHQYRTAAEHDSGATPIATSRLAVELHDVVKGYDWVVSGSSLAGWVPKLWNIDDWSRFSGRSLGTGTQIGIGMGTALAFKDTDRLCVHMEPDGDLLFDPGVLWTIKNAKLPMLVVLYNNRAYFNDVEHQVGVARERGRDESRALIGMDLSDPPVDFASVARGFGWDARGPIENPAELHAALEWGAHKVSTERVPVLVDVVTSYR